MQDVVVSMYTNMYVGGVWIRWNGMVEWTGLEWTGMDWNGMEWNDQMICGRDRPLTL